MKTRVFSLALVIVLLLGLVPAVSAQSDPTCFNLPAADCEILLSAMANTDANLNSFAMDYSFALSLAGLATMGPMLGSADMGDISVTSDGTGAFAYMADAAAFPPIAMTMDLNGAVMGIDEDESGSFSFIIVDGNFYMENPDEMGQWLGFSILEAMAASDFEALGLPFDLESLMAGEMPSGALSPEDMMPNLGALGLPEDMDLSGMAAIPGFINYQRLADTEMMGQTMYVFSLDMDTAPLFASTEFQTMLTQALQAAAAEDPSAAQMTMMIPMLMSGVALTANQTQYIGASDNFVHGMSLDINASLDLGAMMATGQTGSGGTEMQLPPITLDIHFDVNLDQLNGTFEIVAPAGAQMVDPSQFDMELPG
ncbi:MAG: hypothetical protein JW910_06535 [Anaerolineae bacterium]|nr:hypothetical protein [Anaerolineae bacterium]